MSYTPYQITGGTVLEKYKQFVAIRQPQIEARSALASEYGATDIWATPTQVYGLRFIKHTQPEGWVTPKGGDSHTYWPPGNTEEGKQLRKRFRSLPLSGACEFQKLLGMGSLIMDGLRIQTTWAESIEHDGEETIIVHVPACREGRSAWKKHCLSKQTIKLKKSKYLALKGE